MQTSGRPKGGQEGAFPIPGHSRGGRLWSLTMFFLEYERSFHLSQLKIYVAGNYVDLQLVAKFISFLTKVLLKTR